MPESMFSTVVFPAPFGPKKAVDGSFFDLKVQAVNCRVFVEPLRQVKSFNGILRHTFQL
jgi:hypothetical protein